MLDGRHTGTGGGNHIVLGGATPADSPFLRRPDLLRSLRRLLAQPSVAVVSVLGPVHRPDEPGAARRRGAARQRLRAGDRVRADSPQASGRDVVRRGSSIALFRHLLVDVTGNTHRAEFCIDKLYSPDSASGRRGLLEMRAFEMPPHARMSLAQQLLLRALVARFWREPYQTPLVRWGTELHDRFMLPYFVWHDFADVLDDLQRRRLRVRSEWFAPHFEFRFPLLRRASPCAAMHLSCGRRSSRGTCSARKARPAARRGTSIRRSSGCRCTSPA